MIASDCAPEHVPHWESSRPPQRLALQIGVTETHRDRRGGQQGVRKATTAWLRVAKQLGGSTPPADTPTQVPVLLLDADRPLAAGAAAIAGDLKLHSC